MKMIAQYLEHSFNFERLAAMKKTQSLRRTLKTAAYRKLATAREKISACRFPSDDRNKVQAEKPPIVLWFPPELD